MSLAKVTTVKAARKAQQPCGRCGKLINIGDSYLHFTVGFRSTFKRVRCTQYACFPKPSERESSKLASIYSAQEGAHLQLDGLETTAATSREDFLEAVTVILQELAQTVAEVAEEYTEASVSPTTGAVFNTDAEERGEALQEIADEMDNWEPDVQYDEAAEDQDDALATYVEDVLQEARDAVESTTDI